MSRNNGATPLHYAAKRGELDMITLLLASGGRPDISDKAGWTPHTTANNRRHYHVAQLRRTFAAGK